MRWMRQPNGQRKQRVSRLDGRAKAVENGRSLRDDLVIGHFLLVYLAKQAGLRPLVTAGIASGSEDHPKTASSSGSNFVSSIAPVVVSFLLEIWTGRRTSSSLRLNNLCTLVNLGLELSKKKEEKKLVDEQPELS
ncbi:hypothetical protein LY76DRAFT_414540 [Colletotrichum caudatum]|nr:hypothetical protein LY76DRAFT_414540 [Colletotrichum caudatum]